MEALSELEGAIDVLVDLLLDLEDDPFRDEAFDAADRVAELEYGTDVLRRLGETLGDMDYFNQETVYGAMAARCADALYFLLRASIGDAEACLALDEYRYPEAIEDKLYPYIDNVVEEVVDDALASREAAWPRLQALVAFERAGRRADEKGKVFGFDADALLLPRARDWTTEYAKDAAGLIDFYTIDILEDDDAPLGKIPGFDVCSFRPRELAKATAGLLVGQSWIEVANWRSRWDDASWDFTQYVDRIREAPPDDRAAQARNVQRAEELAAAVLDGARQLAAHHTAYVVLDRCLIRERAE